MENEARWMLFTGEYPDFFATSLDDGRFLIVVDIGRDESELKVYDGGRQLIGIDLPTAKMRDFLFKAHALACDSYKLPKPE